MYDHIIGEVVEAQGTRTVLRVAGIGYEFKVPVRTSAGLRTGDNAQLYTILHVVDGTPSLIGFGSKIERELARRILTVSGIGPSIALALLSTHEPEKIAGLILAGDVTGLKKVKGVGAKTAERLCLELRDHVAKLPLAPTDESAAAAPSAADSPQLDDAVAALVTLGYAEADARKRAAKVAEKDPDADIESLIRTVLQG